jgi:hypothetical protein
MMSRQVGQHAGFAAFSAIHTRNRRAVSGLNAIAAASLRTVQRVICGLYERTQIWVLRLRRIEGRCPDRYTDHSVTTLGDPGHARYQTLG